MPWLVARRIRARFNRARINRFPRYSSESRRIERRHQFAALLHGLDAIEHEIHQNLLQLHAVRIHCRKRRVELTADGNGIAMRHIAQQNDHLADDLV